jgi:hypothetical protein
VAHASQGECDETEGRVIVVDHEDRGWGW